MAAELAAIAALVANRSEVGTVARVAGLAEDCRTLVETLADVGARLRQIEGQVDGLQHSLAELALREAARDDV